MQQKHKSGHETKNGGRSAGFIWPRIGIMTALLAGALALAPLNAARAASEAGGNESWVELGPRFAEWGLGIKGQNRRDTCAVFTFVGALEYALSARAGRGVRLSEEYINWAANEATGDPSDGATFAHLVVGFDKWGTCEQRFLPYQAKFNPFLQPSARAVDSARGIWQEGFKWHWIARNPQAGLTRSNLAAAKRVLRRGWPVAAGGEHCVLLTGFVDDSSQPGGGTFQTRNYANRKVELRTYADVLQRFESLLWVELPPTQDGD